MTIFNKQTQNFNLTYDSSAQTWAQQWKNGQIHHIKKSDDKEWNKKPN